MLIAYLAFMAGVMVSASLLQDRIAKQAALIDGKTVAALVAREPLKQWHTIDDPEAEFRIVEMPAKQVPPLSVPAYELYTLKGKRLRKDLSPDQVLHAAHLYPRDASVLDYLAPGKRAMSVDIRAEPIARFFVVPGSRVDIVEKKGGHAVLENVLVLGLSLDKRPNDKAPVEVDGTVMLQLDNNEQVLKLAREGRFWLEMRLDHGGKSAAPPPDEDKGQRP
jgi:Flp pilus assembly protein CpaB